MFCSKCGNEIDNEALICPKCGCATANMASQKIVASADTSGETGTLEKCALIFAVIGPTIGLILGIIGTVKYKNEAYKKKSITAIILSPIMLVVYYVILFLITQY